ncbi:DUF2239 family protein [Komagataeibacter sp. FNDCF1]|uniref:DUF2239 family protein n=1 Tax=Komagataeibacter sp. FNDCF1 TaxID=2878681 RepID=UPI001E60C118|nr:DUF2239 family protein [Komagataeibacter sp. FNDCF1]MCE2564816.1 DUF2239 family protein [Komagataeibacter sp. FNDCF1]
MKNMNNEKLAARCTAFVGSKQVAAGTLVDVALALNPVVNAAQNPVLIFEDATGSVIDVELHGTTTELVSRLSSYGKMSDTPPEKRPGRPKMGVIAREITLLPRHWDWLAQQQGGASQTLRRLIDKARQEDGDETVIRLAHERTYRFMSALAGDYPQFEEASRALFARDFEKLGTILALWPEDVKIYVMKLLQDQPAEVCL